MIFFFFAAAAAAAVMIHVSGDKGEPEITAPVRVELHHLKGVTSKFASSSVWEIVGQQ